MTPITPTSLSSPSRPIAFTADLVRAIRQGRKTQTRRAIWPPPDLVLCAPGMPPIVRRAGRKVSCRYGQAGDLLWLREKWAPDPRDSRRTLYGADAPLPDGLRPRFYGAQSMPRARCRSLLEILSIRVQRLQDICPADAIAEGIFPVACASPAECVIPADGAIPADGGMPADGAFAAAGAIPAGPDFLAAFARFWDALSPHQGRRWQDNPWVWAVEFRLRPATPAM